MTPQLDRIGPGLPPTSADLETLLDLVGSACGVDALSQLRQSFAAQCLRAIEIGLLADHELVDLALNPGLYLGAEGEIIRAALARRLGNHGSESLVRHFRDLLLSGALSSNTKQSTDAYVYDVLARMRSVSAELRCCDCGYHFLAEDMGAARREVAIALGFEMASERLARRLRDLWKPGDERNTQLSMDHVVPEAALGGVSVDNLRVACNFCNDNKKIYRWQTEVSGRDVAGAFLTMTPTRGQRAARSVTYATICRSPSCAQCGQGPIAVELTAAPEGGRGKCAALPWTMQTLCYQCFDPTG